MITAIKKTNNQASTEITKNVQLYVQLLQKSRNLGRFYFTPISRDYEYNSIKIYKDENGNSYNATITAPC